MTTKAATSRVPSVALQAAIAQFDPEAVRGYLGAASIGIPTRETVEAQLADIEAWRTARLSPGDYDNVIERTRRHYASLVSVDVERVAMGSQTSVMVSLFCSAAPSGSEVLCVDGDFSSVVFPFLQRPDITVRSVPLEDFAAEITERTWIAAFSFAQSATGAVADVDAIIAAAASTGTYTLCDTTQAAGVHPIDASRFDATVCHAYKWLCAPRGVAFLTINEHLGDNVRPTQAGWYAGDSVWDSCYGPSIHLAPSARRFDVSPAWPAWIGAEPAIRLFASLDIAEIWQHASGLGDALCDALAMPQQHQAIVTWADPGGSDLKRLTDAGLTVSGRAGRLRTAFHLWNDQSDVDAVVAALGR